MDSIKENLEALRESYYRFEVSALVGAGFSKNVVHDYPSWYELLHDMVAELYKFEIESNFKINGHIRRYDTTSFECYEKEKIKEIIGREGYLNIVSKYIERKGFREAIEVYIEDRIPYIDEDKGDLIFPKKEVPVKITPEDLSLHKKLLEGAWDNIYTTNYDSLIEYAVLKEEKQWDTIVNDYELSFSKQKPSIIKIHGNLRNINNKEDYKKFEFDGNHHQRYIISKEDYDHYPADHEAFTQLMRISLLQGCFCLLGFSGDDPNFIAWIKWVRDILVKDHNGNGYDDGKAKVYLITVDDNILSSEKQLFYQNHRICNISLQNKIVKELLGVSDKTDPKALLEAFLDYLFVENKNSISNYNDKHIYQRLWNEVFSSKNKSVNEKILNDILKSKSTNRIVKYTHTQEDILSEIFNKEIFDNQDIELVLVALADTYFLPQYYPGLVEKIDNCKKTDEQTKQFELLKEHYNTLHLYPSKLLPKNDASTFEQILRIAFALDFETLHDELTKWTPTDNWLQKKASMISFFDKETAKNLLLGYIDSKPDYKERFYATQLLNLINEVFPVQYSTANYENQNLDGLFDLRDALVKQATQEKVDIKPYGDSRKTSTLGGENIKYEHSLRVLQFLIESGTMISYYSFWTFMDAKDWYKVFYVLFEEYPYPTLYYSIQCSDNDILKRIGQDYAYSNKLYEQELPDILDKLLTCILSDATPDFLKKHILVIAQELFVSVKPNVWETKFIKIWENIISPHYQEIDENNDYFKFVCRGLPFLSRKNNIIRVILDCMTNAKAKQNVTINYLFFLHINCIELSTKVSLAIDNFVKEIDAPKEFTIAGNIHPLLSPENIICITKKIARIICGNDVPEIALTSASHFAKDSEENRSVIKTAIVNNRLLWDNGIMDQGASPAKFIHFSKFGKELNWKKAEIENVFEKLKTKYVQLTESNWYKEEKTVSFFRMEYEPLLEEMSRFLCDYEHYLYDLSDYQNIKESVLAELNKKYKHEDVNKLIFDDDRSKVISGLNQLYREISISSIDEHLSSIYLILDRIIFKKMEGLMECFDYIAFYLSKHYSSKKELPIEMKQKLLTVMDRYSQEVIQKLGLDVPKATKYLIAISDSLKKHNIQSESIEYWQGLKRSKRFRWDGINM
ncbi:MAG: SIR2 family protein [Bacteroidales bacterium]|nr:SIR2 family protein [Bacteroidales bacterium]